MIKKPVKTVRAYWDDSDRAYEGWYAEARDADGHTVSDSQKIWFPVKVDRFTPTQASELREALEEAFEGATVTVAEP